MLVATVCNPTIQKIEKLCQSWGMSREDFRRASIVFCEMFRNSAPEKIRVALITDRLSNLPLKTVAVCEVFLLAYAEADERCKIAGIVPDPTAIWQAALALLTGGRYDR